MKVKELIAKLKKQDPMDEVVWRDHDQSEGEYNGHVEFVTYCEIDGESLVILSP